LCDCTQLAIACLSAPYFPDVWSIWLVNVLFTISSLAILVSGFFVSVLAVHRYRLVTELFMKVHYFFLFGLLLSLMVYQVSKPLDFCDIPRTFDSPSEFFHLESCPNITFPLTLQTNVGKNPVQFQAMETENVFVNHIQSSNSAPLYWIWSDLQVLDTIWSFDSVASMQLEFPEVTSLTGNLQLANCKEIQLYMPFLETIPATGTLEIVDSTFKSIDLSYLDWLMGGLSINGSRVDLLLISSISTVMGTFCITNSWNLTDLNFKELIDIRLDSQIIIDNATDLLSLEFSSSPSSFRGRLEIANNPKLKSLVFPFEITSYSRSYLEIRGNELLQTIVFANLGPAYINFELIIEDNPNLTLIQFKASQIPSPRHTIQNGTRVQYLGSDLYD